MSEPVCQSCGWPIVPGDPRTTVDVFSLHADKVDEGIYHTTCLNHLLDLRPVAVPPAEPDMAEDARLRASGAATLPGLE